MGRGKEWSGSAKELRGGGGPCQGHGKEWSGPAKEQGGGGGPGRGMGKGKVWLGTPPCPASGRTWWPRWGTPNSCSARVPDSLRSRAAGSVRSSAVMVQHLQHVGDVTEAGVSGARRLMEQGVAAVPLPGSPGLGREGRGRRVLAGGPALQRVGVGGVVAHTARPAAPATPSLTVGHSLKLLVF